MQTKAHTCFGKFVGIGGLVEQFRGVLVLVAEEPPPDQLLVGLLLELLPLPQLIPHFHQPPQKRNPRSDKVNTFTAAPMERPPATAIGGEEERRRGEENDEQIFQRLRAAMDLGIGLR